MKRHLLMLGVLALIIGLFVAAVTPNSIIAPQTPKYQQTAFVAGTDTAGTYKTAYTGGANGTKITGIFIGSTDTAVAHLFTVQMSVSTSAHCTPVNLSCSPGAAATIPINSGIANAVPVFNLLSPGIWPGLPRDSDGNPYLYLSGSSQTIEATYATALTASTIIVMNVVAADF